MKTINAPVRANGKLSFDLDSDGLNRACVKRRSRRQDRHQLRQELHRTLAGHLADSKALHQVDQVGSVVSPTAVIIPFPQVGHAGTREIVVIRKTIKRPFERQLVERQRLVA